MIRFFCLLSATALLAGASEAQKAVPGEQLTEQQPPGAEMTVADLTQTGSLSWLPAQSDFAPEFRDVGRITLSPVGVIGVAPLTWSVSRDLPRIDLPAGAARFMLAHDQDESRVSGAPLACSDSFATSGDDGAAFPVDTGPADFFERPMAAAMPPATVLPGPQKNLCNGWSDAMTGEARVVGHILPLPDKTLFPIASSGWDDGGYPVARLRSAHGETIALCTDFIGKNAGGDWLLPPDCGMS